MFSLQDPVLFTTIEAQNDVRSVRRTLFMIPNQQSMEDGELLLAVSYQKAAMFSHV